MKNHISAQLGFDEKTERVYRALLSLADAPASIVARRAGVKRTSAYHILENLISMGLVSSYIDRGRKRFIAENPTKLKTFFERQAILAERLIPEFEKEIRKRHMPYTIKIFEGKEAIRGMNEEALNSAEKKILSMGSSKRLIEFLGEKFGFGKRRRERGIVQQAIRFSDDESVSFPVKFFPHDIEFPGYIFMFDTTIGIIPFAEPPRGYLINDPQFAKMARSLFFTFWKHL